MPEPKLKKQSLVELLSEVPTLIRDLIQAEIASFKAEVTARGKSVGVAASARYEFRPDWFLNADASYSRFVGDAKDSPIVAVGDENQYTFGLGLSKRFTLDLF